MFQRVVHRFARADHEIIQPIARKPVFTRETPQFASRGHQLGWTADIYLDLHIGQIGIYTGFIAYVQFAIGGAQDRFTVERSFFLVDPLALRDVVADSNNRRLALVFKWSLE